MGIVSRHLREIRPPSSLCAEAIARAAPVPVLRAPDAIQLDPTAAGPRSFRNSARRIRVPLRLRPYERV
jgi:hypothetical protein